MSTQLTKRDPWRWPMILLWGFFFVIGLWPEFSYSLLRSAGYVFSQNAIVNSYHFITWCLTGFVVHFVYHRCLEARVPSIEALGKALQLGVMAFVAFIDIPLQQISAIRDITSLSLVLGMTLTKMLCWLYLYLLFVRYHWRRNPKTISLSLNWLALGAQPARKTDTSDGEHSAAGSDTPTAHANSLNESADRQA